MCRPLHSFLVISIKLRSNNNTKIIRDGFIEIWTFALKKTESSPLNFKFLFVIKRHCIQLFVNFLYNFQEFSIASIQKSPRHIHVKLNVLFTRLRRTSNPLNVIVVVK